MPGRVGRSPRSSFSSLAPYCRLAQSCPDSQEGSARKEERRLADALDDLQKRGLKIIYSSEVVRPDMRVPAEPRATSMRRILDELLSPARLDRQERAGRQPAGREEPAGPARADSAAPETPLPAAMRPPRGCARFEETIDRDRRRNLERAMAGPPPLALRPLEVRRLAGGFENIFRTLQALPGVASDRGTWQPDLGPRRWSRSEPDDHGRHRDPQPVPARHSRRRPGDGRAGERFQPGNHRQHSSSFLAPSMSATAIDSSSLLVVTHREGSDAEAFQGSSFLSVAEANVILEGRLPRRASGSWLVSARRTHLDLLAEPVDRFRAAVLPGRGRPCLMAASTQAASVARRFRRQRTDAPQRQPLSWMPAMRRRSGTICWH